MALRFEAKRGKNLHKCPQCKEEHDRESRFCNTKCKQAYNAQVDKEERLEAASYLLSIAGYPPEPVKVYTKEEIAAIAHTITPIDQIPDKHYAFIRSGITR